MSKNGNGEDNGCNGTTENDKPSSTSNGQRQKDKSTFNDDARHDNIYYAGGPAHTNVPGSFDRNVAAVEDEAAGMANGTSSHSNGTGKILVATRCATKREVGGLRTGNEACRNVHTSQLLAELYKHGEDHERSPARNRGGEGDNQTSGRTGEDEPRTTSSSPDDTSGIRTHYGATAQSVAHDDRPVIHSRSENVGCSAAADGGFRSQAGAHFNHIFPGQSSAPNRPLHDLNPHTRAAHGAQSSGAAHNRHVARDNDRIHLDEEQHRKRARSSSDKGGRRAEEGCARPRSKVHPKGWTDEACVEWSANRGATTLLETRDGVHAIPIPRLGTGGNGASRQTGRGAAPSRNERVREWFWMRKTSKRPCTDEQWKLPLYAKKTPTMNWHKLNGFVKTFGDTEEIRVWTELTSKYSAGIEPSTNIRPAPAEEATKHAELSKEDIEALIAADVIRQTSERPQALGRYFTVVEEAKQRRRLIVHPTALNAKDVEVDLTCIKWPTPNELQQRVNAGTHASLYDFSRYFHHFSTKIGEWYALTHGGKTYVPTVIPTGGREPPLFGQLLATILARVAANEAVTYDVWIDNVRFVGEPSELDKADQRFVKLCQFLGLTIGERQVNVVEYDFLGVRYRQKTTSKHGTVRLAEKMVTKLNRIELREEMQYDDVASAGGLTLFAAAILAPQTRAEYYFVFKFLRRVVGVIWQARPVVRLWPMLFGESKNSWVSWIALLSRNEERTIEQNDTITAQATTLITDSSLTGWGAIAINEEAVTIAAGRWHEHGEHINLLELRTVRLALQRLPIHKSLHLIVDNTSVIGRVARGWTNDMSANLELLYIQRELQKTGSRIESVQYITSQANPADPLSRLFPTTGAVEVATRHVAWDGDGVET